jgi:predicted nuclease of predicted toxin-antitoxin system
VSQRPAGIARLYFDEDADGRLADALRRRGYDVETTADAGRLSADDEPQLAYAASRQRVLVTHNVKDFPDHHVAWMQAARTHGGIVILIGHDTVGTWLRRMVRLLSRLSAEDLRNQLVFLGAEYD